MAVTTSLSPAEMIGYQRRKDAARQGLAQTKSQTVYGRGVAEQGAAQQREALKLGYDQQRLNVPSQWSQRGMLNSGLYKSSLSKLAQARLRGERGISQTLQNKVNQFSLQDQNAEAKLTNQLAAINEEVMAKRAMLAALLGQG